MAQRTWAVTGFIAGLIFAICAFTAWNFVSGDDVHVVKDDVHVVKGDLSFSYKYGPHGSAESSQNNKASAIAFHSGYLVVTTDNDDGTQLLRVFGADLIQNFAVRKR